MNSRRSRRDIFLTAAVILAWAAAYAIALAQQQPGDAEQYPPGQQQPGMQGQPGSAMPGSAVPGNSSQSFGDQEFIRKTLESNVAQEQMGQLAQQKSRSDDVKQFGQKMAQIHEQLTEQLMPVAKKLGVDQPKQPSKKDRQEIQRMQTLSGPDFDAAFIRAMLHTQQQDVKSFKDEAQGAQEANVQHLAKMDEPVLSQHLQILQQIAQSHNVSAETSK